MSKIQRRNARFANLEVTENVFIEGGIRGYSSWKIYNIIDTGLVASTDDVPIITDKGTIYLFYDTTNTSYVIDKDTGIVATYPNRYIPSFFFLSSALGRYFLGIDILQVYIAVHEDQTELWHRNVADDRGAYVVAVPPIAGYFNSISSKGEWIAVEVKEAVTLNALIFIYRGVKA